VALQDFHFNRNGYTTSGLGALDLRVNNQALDIPQGRIGGRVAYTISGHGGYTFTPEVHAFYLHNFGSNEITETSTFTGGSQSFGTAAAPPVTFSGVYDYIGGATSHNSTVFFRFRTEF
jgi:outer membrane autotransporter protein